MSESDEHIFILCINNKFYAYRMSQIKVATLKNGETGRFTF